MKNIEKLCSYCQLGQMIGEPRAVSGGLMHRMYRVSTDKGVYAIKQLNPDIMKRPEALRNMVNSEKVSNALKHVVPLVAAKEMNGSHVIRMDGRFYEIFDWLEGCSVFALDITVHHCRQMGQLLGRIHAADVRVDGMERNDGTRSVFDWPMLFEKAQQCYPECFALLRECAADIMRWDEQTVCGLKENRYDQVISHCDLDPKNVMWQDGAAYIIDWEAAGYVNPCQELIEMLNYWISDAEGAYDREKFAALIDAYAENMDLSHINWDAVLACSFNGMLGWLEYNVKRALGLEGSDERDRQEGLKQTGQTIRELKAYEAQTEMLKTWIQEFVSAKYGN